MSNPRHQSRSFSLAEFDFERLAACYKELRWYWSTPHRIPDAQSLRESAYQLRHQCVVEGLTKLGCGGIYIVNGHLELNKQLEAVYVAADVVPSEC